MNISFLFFRLVKNLGRICAIFASIILILNGALVFFAEMDMGQLQVILENTSESLQARPFIGSTMLVTGTFGFLAGIRGNKKYLVFPIYVCLFWSIASCLSLMAYDFSRSILIQAVLYFILFLLFVFSKHQMKSVRDK